MKGKDAKPVKKSHTHAKKPAVKTKAVATLTFPKTPKGEFLQRLHETGISDRVVEAFSHVDQEIFFDSMFRDRFYGEGEIPIGFGQRSDNFLNLARMIDHLNPGETDRILEVGTGSGYSSAVLSLLCREVVTVEMQEKLARYAKGRLYENNFGNIRFFMGDGTEPDENYGTINGAIIHAACRKRPLSVLVNMKARGRVVYPMGPAHIQQIALIENRENMESSATFDTHFFEQGVFSIIEGPYGYDNIRTISIEELLGEGEGPPKRIESKDFLFKPNTEE
jgi:protein-L-isoaspartate(D-aspartate) O-methyltransferase